MRLVKAIPVLGISLVLLSGRALGQVDAGAAQSDPPLADVVDGGASTVEVHGLQVPIETDPSLPGHRPVEGTIDSDDLPRRTSPPPQDRGIYDDFLDSHLERWTVTTEGTLVPGIRRHYIRIHPVNVDETQIAGRAREKLNPYAREN